MNPNQCGNNCECVGGPALVLDAIFGRRLPATTTPGDNAFALQSLNDAIRDELDKEEGELKIVGVAVHVLVEDEYGERGVITLESAPGVLDAVNAFDAAAMIARDALHSVGGGK